MPLPTLRDLITLSSTSNGLISESLEERMLSVLAMLASGTGPDGTLIPPLGRGPWTAFQLLNGWKAMTGAIVPSWRLEGDVVRFKGTVDASAAAGAQNVAVMPPAIIPSTSSQFGLYLPAAARVSNVYVFTILGLGNQLSVLNQTVDGWLLLDGLTYTLA